MPLITTRGGVPSIFLAVDKPSISVPSLVTLVYTASAVSPDTDSLILNDVNQPLLTTDTYQVMVGLVGIDPDGGYTVNFCSPGSGIISITSGQVIQITVPNANWPANFQYCVCAAIFLKTNSGNFQLAQFAYVDQSDAFKTFVKCKPLRSAPSFTAGLLQSTTEDRTLGGRDGYGVDYPEEISPTTGAVTLRYAVSAITISPNTGADFQIATSRSTSLEFQSLVNDIKAFVQAAGGNYVSVTSGGVTNKESHMALSTAQAVIRGNKPVKLVMPADETGAQEIVLLIGNLTVNQQELQIAWSKSDQTPVSFRFDPAALDKLITNQHTEIHYLVQT